MRRLAPGIAVSPVGLGAGALGDGRVSDGDAAALLDAAAELGVTLVDTARSYGASEERIGRWLATRARDRVVVSTKGGYGVGGADWTAEAIERGVDDALRRLGTDYVDVFHFHSCPLDVAQRGDLLDALERAKRAGKIRASGYSGENEALAWAVASGRFDVVECSVNVFDQRALAGPVASVAARGDGVIAKRALANAPWRFAEQPRGDYCETYWLRMRAMGVDPAPLAWDELAIRFAAHAPGVACALVGTASVAHLRAAVAHAAAGPLPGDVLAHVRAAFAANDRDWRGEV